MSKLPYYYTLVLVTKSQEWPCNFLSRQSNQMSLSIESTMQFLFDSCISQGNNDYTTEQKIKDSNILNLLDIHIPDNVSGRFFGLLVLTESAIRSQTFQNISHLVFPAWIDISSLSFLQKECRDKGNLRQRLTGIYLSSATNFAWHEFHLFFFSCQGQS